MPLAESVVIFEKLNDNHSYCSVWLKDKDRFCRRTVANSDQKRRRFLLQSISCGREYAGNDAEEIADLYFCKGWHRKGGRYAISSTERLKVLQMCFPRSVGANEASTTPQPGETNRGTAPPNKPRPSRYVVRHGDSPFALAPVLMTGNQTASLSSDPPAFLVTNISSRFEGPEIPEAERLSFSIAQSALNSMEDVASTLSNLPAATSTLVPIRAESSPVEPPPWERDSQAEHLSPDHVNETSSIFNFVGALAFGD